MDQQKERSRDDDRDRRGYMLGEPRLHNPAKDELLDEHAEQGPGQNARRRKSELMNRRDAEAHAQEISGKDRHEGERGPNGRAKPERCEPEPARGRRRPLPKNPDPRGADPQHRAQPRTRRLGHQPQSPRKDHVGGPHRRKGENEDREIAQRRRRGG